MRAEVGAEKSIGHEKYQRLIADARNRTRIKVAVAHPCDDVSLRDAVEAAELGLIEPILVAPPERLAGVAREARLDISKFEVVESAHSHDSASKAVGLVTLARCGRWRRPQGSHVRRYSRHAEQARLPVKHGFDRGRVHALLRAIALFVYRIVRELGSLVASLSGIDALVFSGGIGEHDGATRAEVAQACHGRA